MKLGYIKQDTKLERNALSKFGCKKMCSCNSFRESLDSLNIGESLVIYTETERFLVFEREIGNYNIKLEV